MGLAVAEKNCSISINAIKSDKVYTFNVFWINYQLLKLWLL